MTAIVLTPPHPPTVQGSAHLDIFPGAATPTVFPADTAFWIGYGFTAEASGFADADAHGLAPDTRFELEVDGAPALLVTDTRVVAGRTVGTHSVCFFQQGLPAGWHRFQGRWYEAGALVLSSDSRVEFVEP